MRCRRISSLEFAAKPSDEVKIFTVVGYLVAIGLYLAPVRWFRWHPSPSLVFAVCPPAFLTITVDPSFTSVAIILAPLNALVYGLVGLPFGLGLEEFRDRRAEFEKFWRRSR
jgi:hypothetical protein